MGATSNVDELQLSYKPDAMQALKRMEAFWDRGIIDRPTLQVVAPRPTGMIAPTRNHRCLRDRWMDVEYAIDIADYSISSTYYAGEIFPSFVPNLGPELLTAAYGAELEFGNETSWSIPLLTSWDAVPTLALDTGNVYVKTILEMTRMALDKGRGKYLTGFTDLHPGGDLAASLRDPQQFCIDLAMEPDRAHALLGQVRTGFFQFYDLQYSLMREAGQDITTSWLPLCTRGRYYIPSNDFSIMVSNSMFREFFLDELVEETEWLDRSIYHLDGPGALRHLDTLLEMDHLDGIQFVYGAGNEPASRWMEVYQRIQKAGKVLHISIDASEIDAFMENLAPEGVMLSMWAPNPDAADALVTRVSRWTAPGRY